MAIDFNLTLRRGHVYLGCYDNDLDSEIENDLGIVEEFLQLSRCICLWILNEFICYIETTTESPTTTKATTTTAKPTTTELTTTTEKPTTTKATTTTEKPTTTEATTTAG